jgi:hypothetical protein
LNWKQAERDALKRQLLGLGLGRWKEVCKQQAAAAAADVIAWQMQWQIDTAQHQAEWPSMVLLSGAQRHFALWQLRQL